MENSFGFFRPREQGMTRKQAYSIVYISNVYRKRG